MSFSPEAKAALESELNQIRGANVSISFRHKSRMIDAIIKKYQKALQENTWCPNCHVRPIYDGKCRSCLGKGVIAWDGVYG